MLDPWNTADLSDYCNAILHLNGEPDVPWSIKRSKITGWLAAPLAESAGIMTALRTSSIVAAVLVGAGLYAWGRAAAGRTAGLLAALAGLALGPVVLLSRILTFYPMVAAFLVVGAALCTMGIVSKNPKHLALTGAGMGLALLADVRELVWAVHGAWRRPGPSGGPPTGAKRCGGSGPAGRELPCGPVELSRRCGEPGSPDGRAAAVPHVRLRSPGSPAAVGRGRGLCVGRTGPWDWLQTVWFVVLRLQVPIIDGFPPPVARFAANNHIAPWCPCGREQQPSPPSPRGAAPGLCGHRRHRGPSPSPFTGRPTWPRFGCAFCARSCRASPCSWASRRVIGSAAAAVVGPHPVDHAPGPRPRSC